MEIESIWSRHNNYCFHYNIRTFIRCWFFFLHIHGMSIDSIFSSKSSDKHLCSMFIECIINFIRKKIYVKVINRTLFVQCKHSNGIRLIEIIQNKSYWLCLSYFQGHLKMFYRECWMHQTGKYRDQYRQR